MEHNIDKDKDSQLTSILIANKTTILNHDIRGPNIQAYLNGTNQQAIPLLDGINLINSDIVPERKLSRYL